MDMTTYLRIATLSLLAIVTGGCNAQSHGQSGTQTRTIQDSQWGIPGTVVTMPAGWKFDGVVSHGETCVSTDPGMRWAAESPDGAIEAQHYPQISYSYTNNPQTSRQVQQQGCLVTPYVKPEDFLTHVVGPALHPGAHMEVHPWPDSPDQAKQRATLQQQDRQLNSVGGGARHTDLNSYELVLEYMRGSVKTSQVFVAEFKCSSSTMSAVRYQSEECTVNNASTLRAPEAQMQSLLKTIPVHANRTPEWDARSAKFLQERFAVQNARQMARINNDRQNQIARNDAIIAQQKAQYDRGMQQAQNSSDIRHAGDVGAANHMADQNEFRDPTTGNTYKVSNQYSHTYLDSTGHTILQTNSAYAPGPDTVWQELQPHN
jgi:hypothetical protein